MEKQSEILLSRLEEGFQSDVPDGSKRRILENAAKVFLRRGLAGTRISDIAKEAGFSQGFVYNHYKSKDDIFTDIVRLAAKGSSRAIDLALELEGSAYKRIYWMTEVLTSHGTSVQEHFKLSLLQALIYETIPDEAKKINKESAVNSISKLIPLLIEGQQNGEIVIDDPMKLAMAYYAMIQGIAIMRMQSEKILEFPETDRMLSFLKIN